MQLEDGEQDADLVRMLRGGILLVKVRKQMEENSTHASNNSEIVSPLLNSKERLCFSKLFLSGHI